MKMPDPTMVGQAVTAKPAYDGDTVYLFSQMETVRLLGVDTPEISSSNPLEREAAKIVRDWVRGWMSEAKPNRQGYSLVYSTKDHGKYGRTLTRVWRQDTEEELGLQLLALGFARIYLGKKRKPWSDGQLQAIIGEAV